MAAVDAHRAVSGTDDYRHEDDKARRWPRHRTLDLVGASSLSRRGGMRGRTEIGPLGELVARCELGLVAEVPLV